MLAGVKLKEIARKWGRDFIRYYNAYKTLACDIRFQEQQEIVKYTLKETENIEFTGEGQTKLKENINT